MIVITQSGETADTLAAQREARRLGAKVMTICNVVGSTSAREADSVFYTHSGPEIGVAATKTFTSQILVLLLIALKLAILNKKIGIDELYNQSFLLLLKQPKYQRFHQIELHQL